MSRARAAWGASVLAAVHLSAAGPAAGKTEHVVGQYAYPKLVAAQELMVAERYDEAREIVEDLLEKRINPHERALALQSLAFVQSNQDDWDGAIDSFEKCLELDALPTGAQASTRYNVAQLYLMRERYREAADTLELWFRQTEDPSAAAYYLLATAYALDSRFEFALPVAEKAVQLSPEPRESWLQLLVSLYFEARRFPELATTLEQLAARFPKKTYWMQLSAVYNELGRELDSLAVQQLAYERGMLTEDEELRRLAQLYLFHSIPYRAARVLQRGMEEERIEADAAAWELLANSLIQAREYDAALSPLEQAASLAGDGDLYVRLAQLRIERDEWREAEQALERALEIGTEDPGRAWILLGVSRYGAKRVEPARRAFARAQGFEGTRTAAATWLGHIEKDLAARN